MPTYTVTAHFTCMRCGATATQQEPAEPQAEGGYCVRATPHAPRWRDVTIPRPSGPALRGELCPDCVAQLAAFVRPPKES